jgi:hypothetical protein
VEETGVVGMRYPLDSDPPGPLGGFFHRRFRPYSDTRSVSRQKIADGHPRSVGSIKNQRIS